ncbi:MAG: glycosyltransferase [Canibacter sp.]
MRYFWAIASLALGAILMFVGLGQRTFFAEPTESTVQTSALSNVQYGFITEEELAKGNGTPSISIQGKNVMVAYGQAGDIEAWLAPVGYTQLTYSSEESDLESTDIPADTPDNGETDEPTEAEVAEPEWQDPRGSDLWIDEAPAMDTSGVTQKLKLKPGQAALIASTESGETVNSPVTISWERNIYTPWAGPLLSVGGVLAALGIVLYIIAVDRDRRGLGPRRGRRGPLLGIRDSVKRRKKVDSIHPSAQGSSVKTERRARTVGLVGLTLAGAVVLTGCSPSYWPQFDRAAEESAQTDDENVAASPVTDKQLERIVNEISTTAVKADSDLDADELKKRFSGDALKQRAANYKIRKAEDEYAVLPPFLLNERLGYELIQSTDQWPRTIFIALASSSTEPTLEDVEENADEGTNDEAVDSDEATETEDNSPSLGLMLQQETPQSSYTVNRIFNLRGGINMPSAAPAEEGTAVLDNAISTLKLPPEELGESYATVLTKGEEDEAAKNFDVGEDPVFTSGGANWVKGEQGRLEDQEGEASYSVSAQQSDTAPVALSTGAGGALVATTVVESRVTTAKEGSELPVGNVVKAISGMSGKKAKIVQNVEHQLLFFVPNKSSDDPIQLLGSTSELVGASD